MGQVQGHQPYFKDMRRVSKVAVLSDINFDIQMHFLGGVCAKRLVQ